MSDKKKSKEFEKYMNSLLKKKEKTVSDFFSDRGKFMPREFEICYNPYRHWGDGEDRDNVELYHQFLFDEDGYAQLDYSELANFIRENNINPFADVVEYFYAISFDSGCKGNYTAIYAWR